MAKFFAPDPVVCWVMLLIGMAATAFALPLSEEEIDRMETLEKRHFRIVTIRSAPFVYESQVIGKERLKGFLIDLLEELQSRLNFTYELNLVKDGKYGYEDTEGIWHGMVGELVYDRADMILAPFTIARRRAMVLQYSAPFMEAGIVPLAQKPEPGKSLPFVDLMDLAVEQKQIQYGAIKSGSTMQFFKNSKYELYKAMGDYMTERTGDVLASNTEEAAARVREGGYVFLGEEPTMEWLAGREPCDLIVAGKPINSRGYAFAFQRDDKKSADIFSWELMSIKEDGIYQSLYKKYWMSACRAPKLCVCDAGTGDEEDNDGAPNGVAGGQDGSNEDRDYN